MCYAPPPLRPGPLAPLYLALAFGCALLLWWTVAQALAADCDAVLLRESDYGPARTFCLSSLGQSLVASDQETSVGAFSFQLIDGVAACTFRANRNGRLRRDGVTIARGESASFGLGARVYSRAGSCAEHGVPARQATSDGTLNGGGSGGVTRAPVGWYGSFGA